MIDRPSLIVDPEFAALFWARDLDERVELAKSLREEKGARDPIRYWEADGKNLIVDGQTRYELCLESGLPYKTEAMQFEDRAAAIAWIIRNQLARRNISAVQKTVLRANAYYMALSEKEHGDLGDTVSPKTEEPPWEQKQIPRGRKKGKNVAKEVAEGAGVSERTVLRDKQFGAALSKLAAKSPQLAKAGRDGIIHKKDIIAIADAPVSLLEPVAALPEGEWTASAKALGAEIKKPPIDLKSGKPIVDIRPLAELEKALGKCVRLKSDALKACGGEKCKWAFDHSEAIRHLINQCFDELLAWQRSAEGRKAAA